MKTPGHRLVTLACVAVASVLSDLSLRAAAQSVSLIPSNAVWKYLDTGVDPGTAWRAPADEYRACAPDGARAVRALRQMRTLPRAERERWARRPLVFALPTPAGAAPGRLAAAP